MTTSQRAELVALAQRALRREWCGLLAGAGGAVTAIIPLTNVEHNPAGCGWRADSREQYEAFARMAREGWELLGIVHSHPRTPAYPSDADIERAMSPEAAYVIVSFAADTPQVRAFRIADGRVSEEPIVIEGA